MAFCNNCGTQIPDGAAFCPSCGAKYTPVPAAPTYQQPTYQQPTYQQPVYGYQPPVANAQPEVSTGAKVKGFIGMGLGIGSLAIAVIALIVGFISVGEAYLAGSAIGYSLVAVGLGVPAKILAGKAVEEGFIGTPTKLGSVFGLIGIIVGGVAGFFGIIGALGM